MKFCLIEAPISLGAPTRGTEKAFSALKNSLTDIFGRMNIRNSYLPLGQAFPPNMKYLNDVMSVSRIVRVGCLSSLKIGNFPIVIGGDHSVAIGSLYAAGEYAGSDDISVVWIDAHTDINTEISTVTGYIHGMPLASAMGICSSELTPIENRKAALSGKNTYILGARSIDSAEYGIIAEQHVNLYKIDEIRERGLETVVAEMISSIQTKAIHISLDVDCLDPSVFTSTGYVIENGLFPKEVNYIISSLAATGKVISMDCVEYNPDRDESGEGAATVQDIMKNAAEAFTKNSKD